MALARVKSPTHFKLAPPTAYQLNEIKLRLEQHLSLEHAAAFAGVPRRLIREWVALGRTGDHRFREFTDMLDMCLAKQSQKLLEPVLAAAESGDLSASQWLYNLRVKPYEDRALKQAFQREDELLELEQTMSSQDSDGETEALAEKLMQEMTAEGEKH